LRNAQRAHKQKGRRITLKIYYGNKEKNGEKGSTKKEAVEERKKEIEFFYPALNRAGF